MNVDTGRVSTRVLRSPRARRDGAGWPRRVRRQDAPLWGFGVLVALGLVGLAASSPDADAKATVQPFVGATTVSDVAERVSPSVVSIITEGKRERSGLRGRRGPHDFHGPRSPFDEPLERRMMGVASGVVISADGYIVTNHHVVAGADEIRARFVDGRTLDAKLIGTDEATDLALLEVDAKDLPYLEMGDSNALRLGEIVLAVGNPFGVGETVTMGIVSAKGRSNIGIVDYEDFIQTDAAINPGNSGGALVNLEGKLVGINTAILSHSGGAAGIGFAVPSAMVRPILDQIRTSGTVTRGWLGVAIQDLTPELAKALRLKDVDVRGVVISDVLEGGPAARGGLESGDVVLSLDGKPVTSSTGLRNAIAMKAPGAKAKLVVLRGDERRERVVTLAKKPAEET
ncbi:trypsin-like peptidase domain-containing protein [Myxococcota bacterium]|nr:trypsin-like peptidase domain-containing protein [Myxococcota bacterium]